MSARSSKLTSLWLWVGAAFLALAVGWVVLFTLADQANIESVPLASSPRKGGG